MVKIRQRWRNFDKSGHTAELLNLWHFRSVQPRRDLLVLHGHVLGRPHLRRPPSPGDEEQDARGNFKGSQEQVSLLLPSKLCH